MLTAKSLKTKTLLNQSLLTYVFVYKEKYKTLQIFLLNKSIKVFF